MTSSAARNLDRINLAAQGEADVVRIFVIGCKGQSGPGVDWPVTMNAFDRAGQLGLRVVLGVWWSRTCTLKLRRLWRLRAMENACPRCRGGGFTCGQGSGPGLRSGTSQTTPNGGARIRIRLGMRTPTSWAWQGVQDAEAIWGVNFPVMTAGGGQPERPCQDNTAQVTCVRQFLTDVKSWLAYWGTADRVEMTGAHIFPPISDLPHPAGKPEPGQRPVQSGAASVFPSISVKTFITEVGIPSRGFDYDASKQCVRLLDVYKGWMPSTATAGMVVFNLMDTTDGGTGLQSMGTIRKTGVP